MRGMKGDFLELSGVVWDRLRTRLEGLTDEEYLWEPAPGCWTVRPAGDGSFRADWGLVFTEDPPFTTIAWRVWHIVGVLSGDRCALLLGLEPRPAPREVPGTAAAALDALARAYDLWRGYLSATDEDALRTKLGPQAGQYAEEDRVGFVVHILDEFIHHGAEVGVLRDLYRATRPQDAFVEACLRADRDAVDAQRASDPAVVERTIAGRPGLMVTAAATGRWDAVPLLADLGFPIEGPTGRSALHHAAADGNVELVRMLVERGGDLDAVDPDYRATPLGWAEHFGRDAVVEYLKG